jgi:hypothetical protein
LLSLVSLGVSRPLFSHATISGSHLTRRRFTSLAHSPARERAACSVPPPPPLPAATARGESARRGIARSSEASLRFWRAHGVGVGVCGGGAAGVRGADGGGGGGVAAVEGAPGVPSGDGRQGTLRGRDAFGLGLCVAVAAQGDGASPGHDAAAGIDIKVSGFGLNDSSRLFVSAQIDVLRTPAYGLLDWFAYGPNGDAGARGATGTWSTWRGRDDERHAGGVEADRGRLVRLRVRASVYCITCGRSGLEHLCLVSLLKNRWRNSCSNASPFPARRASTGRFSLSEPNAPRWDTP